MKKQKLTALAVASALALVSSPLDLSAPIVSTSAITPADPLLAVEVDHPVLNSAGV